MARISDDSITSILFGYERFPNEWSEPLNLKLIVIQSVQDLRDARQTIAELEKAVYEHEGKIQRQALIIETAREALETIEFANRTNAPDATITAYKTLAEMRKLSWPE